MDENSRLVRAAVFETTFGVFHKFRCHIIDNTDVARIWREGCADQELNDDDRTRFDLLGEEFIFGLNSIFSQAVAAGNEDAAREMPPVLAMSLRDNPGMGTVWERVRRELTATGRSGFAEAVDSAAY